ncbi:MAG: hypothetical protein ABI895_16500 [Deltaproteobacteria bacterium]
MANYEYRVNGKTVVLQADQSLVGVRFKEPAKHSTRQSVARKAGVPAFERRLEVPNEKFTVLNLAPLPSRAAAPAGAAVAAPAKALDKSDDVARVAQVFRYGSSRIMATDRVLVGLRGT